MEQEGVVSIWMGNTKSQEDLDGYVYLIYNDEGEWVPSQFLSDFNIDMDDIDEHFIEKVHFNSHNDKLDELLNGCSYFEKVIPNICEKSGEKIDEKVNTVILVYNYNYSGEILNASQEGYNLNYYGSVDYV